MKMELSFEDAIKRLEEIAGILEKGQLPLDDAAKLYEEALRLSTHCRQCLENTTQKINSLKSGVI